MITWKLSGLHPYYVGGSTAVEEAELVILGEKQYSQRIDPSLFIKQDNDMRCYPEKDYHEMYMLEVLKVLSR